MFFAALATDYDGTIATDGVTPPDVVAALKAFKATGRRLILVTGRELDNLKQVFPDHDLFDRIVAENGALLYEPATRREQSLAPAPPAALVAALEAQKISPLSVGRVIVATWEPNEGAVLATIKALGLEHQIIFNKGAVMVLPPGINKASGLKAALDELELSAVNVVAVGDAENDHAFLAVCGCSAAVANALPNVKQTCDLVMDAPRGAGVIELMQRIAQEDAALLPAARFGLVPGRCGDADVLLPARGGNLLITGRSAVGKSTLATALTEQMAAKGLQFCILDPEGDFENLVGAVQVGNATQAPALAEIVGLMKKPDTNLVVNALAVPLDDRPAFFGDFLSALGGIRTKAGRPHWLIVDEAHHVLPPHLENLGEGLPHDLDGAIFITVHPGGMARIALEQIRFILAAGAAAGEEIADFSQAVEVVPPAAALCDDRSMLLWDRQSSDAPCCIAPVAPAQVHHRHVRKYAQGELGPDKSFYFRGPDQALNLRAQNLLSFLNIADGVDDGTWAYHRQRGDYSTWMRHSIKDDGLADAVAAIESDSGLDEAAARAAIRAEIEKRYTAPANAG